MTNKLILAGAIFLGLAAPAAAWDTAPDEYNYAPACNAPVPPAKIDAGSHDAVTGFIAASDSYQQCLGRALGARQDTAFFTKTTVPVVVVRQIEAKVRDNQRQKEDVGKAYNAAIAGTGQP
ncbi:MAG TPA: hypothetical protein VFV07_06965 [Rhizomicrobium sp.]|nr:hypothetical protein [Rhizomicrobium sp.]